MARHYEVVRVSVNHRLNILGFFDVSEIGGPAYEDPAMLALRIWCRRFAGFMTTSNVPMLIGSVTEEGNHMSSKATEEKSHARATVIIAALRKACAERKSRPRQLGRIFRGFHGCKGSLHAPRLPAWQRGRRTRRTTAVS